MFYHTRYLFLMDAILDIWIVLHWLKIVTSANQ